MLLTKLIKNLDKINCFGDTDIEVQRLITNSKLVSKGDLFICLKGNNFDGHEYVREAELKGAIAIVCEKKLEVKIPQIIVEDTRKTLSIIASEFYDNPCKKLKIIGITGTNGKTTSTYMLANILKSAGKKVGIIGTLGILYDTVKIAPELTTPDPIFLQQTLYNMVSSGVEYVVMEVSAHAIYYKKDLPIVYEVGIFTNCTQDHLDFFGTMEKYKAVKKSLFLENRCKYSILNVDDGVGFELSKEVKDSLTYGLNSPADVFAVIQEENAKGSKVVFNLCDMLCYLTIPMVGRHNISNALCAAATAFHLKIDLKYIQKGLENTQCVEGRLQYAGELRGGSIFIDFAHTPDGLEKALIALKNFCKGRLLCVFGCGGNRDKGKRQMMGRMAGKNCDFCVLTSDNPRYEDPYDIISSIEKGFREFSRNYVVVQDRRKGIEYAIRLMQKDDILLIAGKGGENYQEIMGIKYTYNDKAVVEEVIAKIGKEL